MKLIRVIEQLDAGMHPAKEGFSALPFFDEFDLSTVDILLISQYVSSRFDFLHPAMKTWYIGFACSKHLGSFAHRSSGVQLVPEDPGTIECSDTPSF